MTTLTEGRHAAEFILSEANGQRSRENGTVKSGQNLAAGQVVQLDTGQLKAFLGPVDTAGLLVTEAVGIVIYPVDATLGTVDVSYIARDAEVNGKLLTYPAETSIGEEALANASLALLGIIVRSGDVISD